MMVQRFFIFLSSFLVGIGLLLFSEQLGAAEMPAPHVFLPATPLPTKQHVPTPVPHTGSQMEGDELPSLPPAWPHPLASPAFTVSLSARMQPPLLQPLRLSSRPLAADFPISALPFTSEEAPAINGNRVIWFDDRTHGPTDVWGYDLSAGQEFQVTSHPVAQFIADISGDIVAYEDNRNGTWDIYATRLSTAEEFAVATGPHHQRYPRIWDDYIVYQDETNDYFQSNTYLYQISTGTTIPLAVADSYQGRPDIHDGWIVWSDRRAGSWQLGIYEIGTGLYRYRSIDCDYACRPRLFDHEVVWNGWRNGSYDIFLYDLLADTEYTIYSGPGQQRYPDISSELIVWQDLDTYGNWNVFVFERDTGLLFPVTLKPSQQTQPAVEGNVVVWQDNRGHTWDIYGLIWDGVIPPGSAPVLQNPRDLHVGAYPDGEIRLSWTDNVTNELGFVIQRAEGIFDTQWQDLVTLPANTTTYTDVGLALGQSYWYRVRAYNATGDSSYSNESYGTAFDNVPNLDERYMHVLINEARMSPGTWGYPGLPPVDPLGWDANFAYSARTHALGMNNSNCCQGHVDLAGRGPSERAFDSGYPYGSGENLFQASTGREGMESAHQGFMHSEGHRNNIMAAGLKQTAIGFAPGGRGTLVEVFSGGAAGYKVPNLPSGIVVPYTGTLDATFDYLVSFWNDDLQPPASARVIIDGTTHAMSLRNGQAGRGTYIFSTDLPLGDHSYHFEFEWGSLKQTVRLPEVGEFTGPFVRSYMPDLRIIGYSQTRLVAGHDAQISAFIYNGGEIATDDVAVQFWLGDPSLGGTQLGPTPTVSHIEPGNTEGVETHWTPQAPGTYTIYVWVDPDNEIGEFDESNNLTWYDLEVREANITWYVDGTVSTSGNGRTHETAFKTIGEALLVALLGDTVLVDAGTYPERFTIPEDVRLLGSGPERTIIDGGGADGSVIHLSPGSAIEGFTISGSGTEYFDAGIWHSEGEVTIRNNRFTGNSVGLFSWCWNPDCGAIAHIENNIFANNTRVATDANNEPIHYLVNNTIVDNGRGIVMNNAVSVAENNIIAQNSGDGLVGNGFGPTVRYNNVWGNGHDYIGVSSGIGDISVDPDFVAPTSGDYHLQQDSPAIDAGNPDIAYSDRNGSRNDIGAYGGPCADFPCAPAIDFDGDGQITVQDLVIIAGMWGQASDFYDLNWDGVVSIIDIQMTAVLWRG